MFFGIKRFSSGLGFLKFPFDLTGVGAGEELGQGDTQGGGDGGGFVEANVPLAVLDFRERGGVEAQAFAGSPDGEVFLPPAVALAFLPYPPAESLLSRFPRIAHHATLPAGMGREQPIDVITYRRKRTCGTG